MQTHILFFIIFNCDNVETAYDLLQKTFSPVVIHCKNCLNVRRNFYEALRGYLIGKRGAPLTFGGHFFSRAAITSIDDELEKSGQKYEISFTYSDIEIVGTISSRCLNITAYDVSDGWIESFKKKMSLTFTITEMKEFNTEVKKNRFFYKDLAKRLEEGDFEGGENRSC